MDQPDPRTTGDRLAVDSMADDRTISIGAMVAILAAAVIVFLAGLSFLTPADRTAQTTKVPSSFDSYTTPPPGTTGVAPRPAPAPSPSMPR